MQYNQSPAVASLPAWLQPFLDRLAADVQAGVPGDEVRQVVAVAAAGCGRQIDQRHAAAGGGELHRQVRGERRLAMPPLRDSSATTRNAAGEWDSIAAPYIRDRLAMRAYYAVNPACQDRTAGPLATQPACASPQR